MDRLFSTSLDYYSDAELGRIFRAAFHDIDDGVRLTTAAARVLVSETLSLNGDDSRMTFYGYTKNNEKVGDWTVHVYKHNKRRKFFNQLHKLKDWISGLGVKKVPLSDLYDPNTKITSLVITENDPFKKGQPHD